MSKTEPSVARVWQYSKTTGGLEKNLRLNSVPIPVPKPSQHLIKVTAASLNAVDYKLTEVPLVGALGVSKPATPGLDIAGEIVIPAANSPLKRGDRVFGVPAGGLLAGGGLSEYTVANSDQIVPIPEGVSSVDAATLPIASQTAYGLLVPNVKAGDKIFLNGGSGAVGLAAIQIAKLLGCHITVTCSSRNVELCKSLGADEVIDYTKTGVLSALQNAGRKFDIVVDAVGGDHELYWKSDTYTNPGTKYLSISNAPTAQETMFLVLAMILPTMLGGQKTRFVPFFAESKAEYMEKLVGWLASGELKACIDSQWKMEDVPEAFGKLKTSRARGKIVINVEPEEVK